MSNKVILFILFVFSVGWAFDPSYPPAKDLILEGIEKTILCDFDDAKKIYDGLIEDYPDEPVGYFYMAAVIQSQMLDEENFNYKQEFEEFIKKCIKKSKNLQVERTDDPWLFFYEGSAYLYQSFLKSKLNDWWGAYRDAGKGVNRLEKSLELDSTFYDAYLGIGSYKYWKSTKIKFLDWLPFITDEREQGIKLIIKAIERGEFVSLIGRDQLAWILIDANRLEEAKRYAIKNHELFPDSRFFQWTLNKVYYQNKEWDKAYYGYDSLLQDIKNIQNNNHYNEVACLLRMAEIHYETGQLEKADSLISVLFSIKLEPKVRERARSKLKRALKIKLQCTEALSGQNKDKIKKYN